MASPCKNCKYLSDDGEACAFNVIMDIPFANFIDFEGEQPEECWMLGYYKLWLEDLEKSICVQDGMLEDFSYFVEILSENLKGV